MVRGGERRRAREARARARGSPAWAGVAAHRAPLPVGRACPACRGCGWRRELADVVQQRRRGAGRRSAGASPSTRRCRRRLGHALGVAGGEGRLGVDHAAKASAMRSSRASSALSALAGSSRRRRAPRARPRTAVVAGAEQRVDQRRIEPAAAARARDRPAARPRRAAWNTSTVCARTGSGPAAGSPRHAGRPAGRGRPSARRAADRGGGVGDRKSMRAISAPRSQRGCMNLRVDLALVLDRRATRARRASPARGGGAPGGERRPRVAQSRSLTCA